MSACPMFNSSSMSENIYEKIVQAEKNDTLSALCIVTKTHGSAPGRPGMKMLVYEDGSINGTIGGGAIEKEVIDRAIELMASSTPQYFTFNLKADLNMECGGGQEVYIEPLNQKRKLFIFGAGHIGKALSHFALTLGFDVTVIDERQGIFQDYPESAIKCINTHFTEAIINLKPDKRSFFVIVTHKHIHDYDILKQLCVMPWAYLGMIGSRIKVEKIRKELVENGIITNETAEAIDMPIGIRFKALTHNEIAISILAKLIDVRNS